MILIFSAKMYARLFGINIKTAKEWIAKDRDIFNTAIITIGHVRKRYELDNEEIMSVFRGNKDPK